MNQAFDHELPGLDAVSFSMSRRIQNMTTTSAVLKEETINRADQSERIYGVTILPI